jgi:hypothetical protein
MLQGYPSRPVVFFVENLFFGLRERVRAKIESQRLTTPVTVVQGRLDPLVVM